ncbi:MAG: hypothetical protein ABFS37_06540 [Acidobacteriota bacterium]
MFIEYTFNLDDGRVLFFHVDFERPRERNLPITEYPEWTRLRFHQCINCPLSCEEFSHCPVAIDAHEIVAGFSEVISCRAAEIVVRTPDREYRKQADVQTGLRALIGFVMASGACPILSTMRGMAYFHQPFASLDETVFRIASSYLLGQYYRYRHGGKPDLDLVGLKGRFREIQTVNSSFLERIRAGCSGDSNLNVLSVLFSISSMVSLSLETHLDNIENMFD